MRQADLARSKKCWSNPIASARFRILHISVLNRPFLFNLLDRLDLKKKTPINVSKEHAFIFVKIQIYFDKRRFYEFNIIPCSTVQFTFD